jgi:hypothetical protein
MLVALVAVTGCSDTGDTGPAPPEDIAVDALDSASGDADTATGSPDIADTADVGKIPDVLPDLDLSDEAEVVTLDAEVAPEIAAVADAEVLEEVAEVAPEIAEDADAEVVEEIAEDADAEIADAEIAEEVAEDADAEIIEEIAQEIVDDVGGDIPVDVPMDTGPPDPVDPYEQQLHFAEIGVGADSVPVLMSQVIPVPADFETVEAQIAIRGDLDAFPAAFMALVVEQDGELSQCGDLAGLPQKPNNILDDVYRVAFPRPQNTYAGSNYYPPLAPWDYQPIPCQEAFVGKTEIEVGIIAVGLYAPGVGTNQGLNACGGAGCPNDAILEIRFLPKPGPPLPFECFGDESQACVCPDGTFGVHICAGNQWPDDCTCDEVPVENCTNGEVTSCACPDGSVGESVCAQGFWEACGCEDGGPSGTCDDGYPFEVGPGAEEVTVALVATNLNQAPWMMPFTSACPMSKPPFSTEYHYEMTITEAGYIAVTFEAIPEPWAITQYWLDMLVGCGVAYQCNNSWSPLEGYADAGTYVVGLTVAPANEIYIPDQDWWKFTITAKWSPGDPP